MWIYFFKLKFFHFLDSIAEAAQNVLSTINFSGAPIFSFFKTPTKLLYLHIFSKLFSNIHFKLTSYNLPRFSVTNSNDNFPLQVKIPWVVEISRNMKMCYTMQLKRIISWFSKKSYKLWPIDHTHTFR